MTEKNYNNLKRRDRLEIIYDILVIVNSNNNMIKKTPLLRFSNISPKSFNLYFDELILKKFILEVEEKGKKVICLGDKGFEYLENYKVIRKFIDDFEL